MKKIVLLVGFIAVLALCAQAQTYINFSDMPQLVKTPTPMPDNYPTGTHLIWDNFLYVTPGLWSGAGAGFWPDPVAGHNIVSFIGGPYCNVAASCGGSIKLLSGPTTPTLKGFQPISISLAAGWIKNGVTVTAYDNAKFIGRLDWTLTTTPQLFKFPAAWPNVTQLVFTPHYSNGTTKNPGGSVVVYSFLLVKH